MESVTLGGGRPEFELHGSRALLAVQHLAGFHGLGLGENSGRWNYYMSGVQFQGHLSPCLSLKAYRRCRNSACARYDRCQSFHIVPSKKLPRCQLTARFTTAWTVGSSLLSSEKSEDAGIRQIRHWLDTWWQNPALAENFYPAKTYTISAPCHAFHVHTCMHIYI